MASDEFGGEFTPDHCALPQMSEASVLRNLVAGYRLDPPQIYVRGCRRRGTVRHLTQQRIAQTTIGEILVAMNPFQQLPLYTDALIDAHKADAADWCVGASRRRTVCCSASTGSLRARTDSPPARAASARVGVFESADFFFFPFFSLFRFFCLFSAFFVEIRPLIGWRAAHRTCTAWPHAQCGSCWPPNARSACLCRASRARARYVVAQPNMRTPTTTQRVWRYYFIYYDARRKRQSTC